MLETIHSITFKKNALFQEDFNIVKNDNINISSLSVFDKMTKKLLSKEMEFNNISTKEKKKHENTVSKNFFINHLINIFYRQDIFLKNNMNHMHKNDCIQKKKWIIILIFLRFIKITIISQKILHVETIISNMK